MSYKPMLDDSQYGPNELLEFALMQRMYEDGLWKNPNYYVGIDDYYAHFFLNFSMQYSAIDCIEELIVTYELKGMTFLSSLSFVKWMHKVASTLVNDALRRRVLCDATRNEYMSCIDNMENKLLVLLQK